MRKHGHARAAAIGGLAGAVHPVGLLAADLIGAAAAVRVDEHAAVGGAQAVGHTNREIGVQRRTELQVPLRRRQLRANVDRIGDLAGAHVDGPRLGGGQTAIGIAPLRWPPPFERLNDAKVILGQFGALD